MHRFLRAATATRWHVILYGGLVSLVGGGVVTLASWLVPAEQYTVAVWSAGLALAAVAPTIVLLFGLRDRPVAHRIGWIALSALAAWIGWVVLWILPFTAYIWYVAVPLLFGCAGAVVFVSGAKANATDNRRPNSVADMVVGLSAIVLYFAIWTFVSWLPWFLVYVVVGALGVRRRTSEEQAVQVAVAEGEDAQSIG